jgi:hypothetical protein
VDGHGRVQRQQCERPRQMGGNPINEALNLWAMQ